MTKREVCEADPYLREHVFDYALPQEWLDEIAEVTGQYEPGFFVWVYDKQGGLSGRPYPVVPEGHELLANYAHKLKLRELEEVRRLQRSRRIAERLKAMASPPHTVIDPTTDDYQKSDNLVIKEYAAKARKQDTTEDL
jgi:hypothetical protein